MNFHTLAPMCYKRSVVESFVHKVYRGCSRWENFHGSMKKLRRLLQQNQYPQTFYDPIISNTIENLVSPKVN